MVAQPENNNNSRKYAEYCFLCRQPYHPVAQDWLSTEAKPGQYLDGRLPGKTRMLLEEVLVKQAGAHPVVCVGTNAPV